MTALGHFGLINESCFILLAHYLVLTRYKHYESPQGTPCQTKNRYLQLSPAKSSKFAYC